jgi:hypothetical protein
MSLEIIIIQFLLGAVAGTVSSLLIVKRRDHSTPLQNTTSHRKLARTRTRATLKQAKTRRSRSRSPRRLRPLVQATETVGIKPNPVMSVVNVSSCPACGLQAPEALMAEHFLGSPSHENGTPEPARTMIENRVIDKRQSLSSEEDAKSSLRSLLQMLVPPRAFGRRHQQRTVNPLSQLVQTIDQAQSALVQPLKGPK